MVPKRIRMERVYVTVNTDFCWSGTIEPRSIRWKDGRIFKIDRVQNFDPAPLDSVNAGDRYTVIINGKARYLFFRRINAVNRNILGKWWVEKPAE